MRLVDDVELKNVTIVVDDNRCFTDFSEETHVSY